jgi:NADPH2:quinone reductase
MRVVVCNQYGPPETLTIEERPDPQPGTGQVRVRIKAAGVNFADLLMVAGAYQVKPPVPFVPGLEFAGIVDAIGAGVDKALIGRRVVGAPRTGGAFAEYALLPAERAYPIADSISFEFGSGLLVGHGTAYYGLVSRAGLKAGEWVLVSGAAGGVGIAAVDVAKRIGAKVIAAASSPDKLAIARAHGADAVINYSTEDLREAVKSITGGKGYNVFLDTVGGDIFDAALRASAYRARLLVIGFAGGRIPTIPANYLMVKNLTAHGVGFGGILVDDLEKAREVIAGLTALHDKEPFTPQVGGTFGLDQVPQALNLLKDRKATGKLVITP